MVMIVLLVGLYLAMVRAECNLPPALWCDNDAIARECQVEDACSRWRTSGQKFDVTVLFETHCPHCQEFILNVIYPELYQKSMKRLQQVHRINFVPWGNAMRLADGRVVCQHGEEECSANRLTNCVLHHLDGDVDAQVNFVVCVEKHLKTQSTLHDTRRQCFAQGQFGQDMVRKVKICFNGALGDRLERQAEAMTNATWPDRHDSVPWILVNGRSLDTVDKLMQNDIAFHINNWHKQANRLHGHATTQHLPARAQAPVPEHAGRVFAGTTHLEVIDSSPAPGHHQDRRQDKMQRQHEYNAQDASIRQAQRYQYRYQRPHDDQQIELTQPQFTVVDPHGLQVSVSGDRGSYVNEAMNSERNQLYVRARLDKH